MIATQNTAEQTAFTNFEITRADLEAFKREVFTTIGAASHLYVAPKMPYQLLINTTHTSPVESAEKILSFCQ